MDETASATSHQLRAGQVHTQQATLVTELTR
jgi:hypothetical protein